VIIPTKAGIRYKSGCRFFLISNQVRHDGELWSLKLPIPLSLLSGARIKKKMNYVNSRLIGFAILILKRPITQTFIEQSIACRAQQTMKEQVNISFFHINVQEMKMDKSKPRYGVIWQA